MTAVRVVLQFARIDEEAAWPRPAGPPRRLFPHSDGGCGFLASYRGAAEPAATNENQYAKPIFTMRRTDDTFLAPLKIQAGLFSRRRFAAAWRMAVA
jgi:hypothetical protein